MQDIWAVIGSYPGYYEQNEAREMYRLLLELGPTSVVVELGSEFGKSATVIGEASKIRGFSYTCVDSYLRGENSKKARARFEKDVLSKYNCTLIVKKTAEVAKEWQQEIDYLFIDADHAAIAKDCEDWLGFVKKGGIAQFHDYGCISFPWMPEIVDSFTEGWEELGCKDSSCFKRKV